MPVCILSFLYSFGFLVSHFFRLGISHCFVYANLRLQFFISAKLRPQIFAYANLHLRKFSSTKSSSTYILVCKSSTSTHYAYLRKFSYRLRKSSSAYISVYANLRPQSFVRAVFRPPIIVCVKIRPQTAYRQLFVVYYLRPEISG